MTGTGVKHDKYHAFVFSSCVAVSSLQYGNKKARGIAEELIGGNVIEVSPAYVRHGYGATGDKDIGYHLFTFRRPRQGATPVYVFVKEDSSWQ